MLNWSINGEFFELFEKLLNFMVGQGMKYSSVSVCLINRIVGHELADLIELHKRVEEGTSIKIDYSTFPANISEQCLYK